MGQLLCPCPPVRHHLKELMIVAGMLRQLVKYNILNAQHPVMPLFNAMSTLKPETFVVFSLCVDTSKQQKTMQAYICTNVGRVMSKKRLHGGSNEQNLLAPRCVQMNHLTIRGGSCHSKTDA